MKKLAFAVCLSALVCSSAHAWLPSGWLYWQYPYAYAFDEGRWYYVHEDDPQLVLNGLSTRSPFESDLISLPVSTTVPMNSCPITVPASRPRSRPW